MNKFKLLIVTAVLMFAVLVVVTNKLSVNAQDVQWGNIVSYPVSYLTKEGYKEYSIYNQGISFRLKSDRLITKYTGMVYRDNVDSITEIHRKYNNEVNEQLTRIIPVDSTESTDTLNLLERFIFTEHGITEKDDQIVRKLGRYNVAQISFRFNEEEEAHYELFSAIKDNNVGYVITTTFDLSKAVNNILSDPKQDNIEEYNDLIASINIDKQKDLNNYYFRKLKKNNEINNQLIELNKQFNSKYITTF